MLYFRILTSSLALLLKNLTEAEFIISLKRLSQYLEALSFWVFFNHKYLSNWVQDHWDIKDHGYIT